MFLSSVSVELVPFIDMHNVAVVGGWSEVKQ